MHLKKSAMMADIVVEHIKKSMNSINGSPDLGISVQEEAGFRWISRFMQASQDSVNIY